MPEKDNPKKNLLDSLKDRRDTIQNELFNVDLKLSDVALAGVVRGLIAEWRAKQETIEDADKFFNQ